ncbi:MAG TPA: NifB/NifX family molybdenum-iron cluster-binding protein [Polyangia bacterium]
MPTAGPSRSARAVRVIAVAARDGAGLESLVAEHFGRCPFYVVVVTAGTVIRAARVTANPHVADQAPGTMLRFLRDLGADVVIVGAVGPSATHDLRRCAITEVTGAAGRVVDAVGAYLRGAARAGHATSSAAGTPR